jgi:hypothetical protein
MHLPIKICIEIDSRPFKYQVLMFFTGTKFAGHSNERICSGTPLGVILSASASMPLALLQRRSGCTSNKKLDDKYLGKIHAK